MVNESTKYSNHFGLARWRGMDEENPLTDTEASVCLHNAILHLLNSGHKWGSPEITLIVDVRLGKGEGA